MKQKFEKVLELTPITMAMGEERAKEIARKWTNKGLDLLMDMWHKYYTNIHHYLINSLLISYSEKQLNLSMLDVALKNIEVNEDVEKI